MNDQSYTFPFSPKLFKMAFYFDYHSKKLFKVVPLGVKYLPLKNPEYILRLQEPITVQADLSFQYRKGERWKIFFTEPPHDRIQQQDMVVSVSPKELQKKLTDDLWYLDITRESCVQETETVQVRYDWKFHQRFLDLNRDGVRAVPFTPLSENERQRFLAADKKYNWNEPSVQDWLKTSNLIKRHDEHPIDFGFRVHMWIALRVPYTAKQDLRAGGAGGVATVVQKRATDCGGKCLLFCSVMRANGIPARMLQGQWAIFDPSFYTSVPPAHVTPYEMAMGFHVISEFFAEGVGWVPLESIDRQGFFFGRDRSKAFLGKHYDFIFQLDHEEEGQIVTEEPYYVSGFHHFPGQEQEQLKERQTWSPRQIFE